MVHERLRRLETLVTSIIRNTDEEFLVDLHDNLDLIDETINLDCSTLTNHCICTVNFEYLHKPEHVIKCLRKGKCFHCQRYQCMRKEHDTVTASTRFILLAAILGKFQVFKFLHQRGCSLESKTGVHELRPIHLVIIHGHFNIFCYLLTHQVDINVTMKSNGTSYSPLMQAVLCSRTDMLRHLLMVKGLDMSYRNSLSQSPLLFAVQQDNSDIMDLLLGAEEAYLSNRQGCSSNPLKKLQHPCAVLEVIKQDNAGVLKTLLDNGCDVDYIFNGYHSYTTAAILAAVKNAHRCLRVLVANGADVRSQIDGFSAYDWAMHLRWTECLHTLKDVRQRLNGDTVNNESKLKLVTDDMELPTDSINNGLQVDSSSELVVECKDIRETPFVHAIDNKPSTVSPILTVWNLVQWVNIDDEIKRFASLGYNVNAQDAFGRTSLHLAVEEQHVHGVRALLQHGADTEIPDCCDATPFWHAVFWNKESMIKELIAANANLECSAIENAYKLGLPSAENYQDQNAQQGHEYKTPLALAVEKNFHETTCLLIEAGYDTSGDNLDKLIEKAGEESRHVLIQHLNKPKTLFATTINVLRRQYGIKIRSIASQYFLPTRIRDCLLLKDTIECAYSQR